MRPQRLLTGCLALVIILAAGWPVASQVPVEPQRDPADAAGLHLAASIILEAQGQRAGSTWNDLDQAARSAVLRELDWAKAERERRARQLRRDLAEVNGPDQACERDMLRQRHRAVDALLASYVSQLRGVRGDRRSGLRKLESRIERHVLQPIGRIVKEAAKASLPELVATYLSGGTLSKSVIRAVAKRNVVRIARRRATDLALEALARKIHGVGAMSVEDARTACEARPEPSASPDLLEPAIPAGTYLGSFSDDQLAGLSWMDSDSRFVANAFELSVTDDGSMAGGWEVRETGALSDADGTVTCGGASLTTAATIDTGQVVGPLLPQNVAVTIEWTLGDTIDYVQTDQGIEAYCTAPQMITYDPEPGEMVLAAYAGGTVTVDLSGWTVVLSSGS